MNRGEQQAATAASATYGPAELARRAIHRRAVEAAIWGMPAVNYELMYREMVRTVGGGFNQILFWSRLLDWKNQTLTPNPDVIYLMPFINTKDVGPMVLEIPPADDGVFNGSVMNYWQAAIEDIGPGGVDKGEGGKYLVLPPGFDIDDVPAGYIVMPSDTYQGYALVRSVLRSGSDADIARAVAYSKRMKLYPLAEAVNPASTVFVDASGVVFDSTIPYDVRFFESLHRMVQAEPWLERDKAMIDPLKTLGIERGQPFEPRRDHAAHSQRGDGRGQGHPRGELRQTAAVLSRWAMVLPDHRRNASERHEFLPHTRLVSNRRPRLCVHDRVLQRQARGPGAVLLDGHPRQGWAAPSRRRVVPATGSGERSGHAVLVDDGV
jgi:hypothetical protein